MGLRCLLGHDFDEPELKREREERGNEVVVTIREVKTCARCGAEQVVSENKEVTSVEQLSAAASDAETAEETVQNEKESGAIHSEDETASEPPEPPVQTAAEPDPFEEDHSVTDDAEIITAGPETDQSPSEPEEPSPEAVVEATPTSNPTEIDESQPEVDDGIILPNSAEDDNKAVSDRDPGAWPEHDDVAAASQTNDPTPWPEHNDEDEGFDATEPSDGGPDEITFGGGFTPEITGDQQAETDEMIETEGFTRVDRNDVAFEPMDDDVQTEFFCPECGLARTAGKSSLRAGDICPECKRGYIAERPL